MSYLPPHLVKQGFWINWSEGAILGSTITTDNRTGNILVAVVAIIITLASAHLWNLLLFVYYHSRANRPQGDGLFRQQQALFRSQSAPDSILVELSRLGWLWHGKARNASIRCLIPGIIALLFFSASLAVGIFSSLIISTTDLDVLVESDLCGFINNTNLALVNTFLAQNNLAVEGYARSCYTNTTSSASCNTYVRSRLTLSTMDSPCPFADQACISSPGDKLPAITMDTGLLDSNDDFGINAKAEDRVKFRQRSTCVPLNNTAFYTISNTPLKSVRLPDGGLKVKSKPLYFFNFGPTHYQNHTYALDALAREATDLYTTAGAWAWVDFLKYSSFKPIPELSVHNADTDLVMIFSNAVSSFEPIDDPVFSAHQPDLWYCDECPEPEYHTFSSDFPAGVIGCTNQYQFCIPTATNGLHCTDLMGQPYDGVKKYFTEASHLQLASLELIRYAAAAQDFASIGAFSPPSLIAYSSLASGVQTKSLPPNHWKVEVHGWMSIILAGIQKIVTDHAIGPTLNDGTSISQKPTEPGFKQICKAQKMQVAGGFSNTNVFGLAFSAAIAALIIIADIAGLKFIIFLSKFRNVGTERWIQDGVLQLQRKAYQAQGEGFWTRTGTDIPITGKNEMLSDFRPNLPRPMPAFGSTLTDDTSKSGSKESDKESEKGSSSRGESSV